VIATGELRRYRIPLSKAIADYKVLTSEAIELPRINYQRCNTHNYQFVYGVGSSQSNNFIDQLVKVNVQNGTTQIWHSSGCYPGEPVFVAAPDTLAEDEGVILSVVLNVQKENSFLLVLDGQSWNELARIEVPYHLPFDFHGQYFDAIAPAQRTQLHR
jgi:carotenoid cleavage dioxygenase-like enzyme